MLDSGTKVPENRIHLFDPVGLINDSYGSYRSSSYAVRPRHPIKSYDNFSEANGVVRSDDSLTDSNSSKDMNGGGGELRFGVDLKLVEDDNESDDSTPRLWKPKLKPVIVTSPPPMHPTSPKAGGSPVHPSSPKAYTSPALHPTSPKYSGSPVNPNPNPNHQYQSMSARTQVIAKGRRELMDMVRDLPESFYELSLKDIVDQKMVMEDKKEINQPEEKKVVMDIGLENKAKKQKKKSGKKVKKSESKKKMVRSKSVDSGGFLLKTSVFPSFMASKKRKKIAPKPKPKPQQPSRTRSMKGREKDWWKRKSCISSESDESAGLSSNSASSSSSSTSRSNSTNGRRSNRFLRSFCFFNGRRIRDKM